MSINGSQSGFSSPLEGVLGSVSYFLKCANGDISLSIKAFTKSSGSRHHCMGRTRVADKGDGLQIWRVAANILNKQSWSADSGWSSSMGVGRGANSLPP
jgi:hypothetical protein